MGKPIYIYIYIYINLFLYKNTQTIRKKNFLKKTKTIGKIKKNEDETNIGIYRGSIVYIETSLSCKHIHTFTYTQTRRKPVEFCCDDVYQRFGTNRREDRFPETKSIKMRADGNVLRRWHSTANTSATGKHVVVDNLTATTSMHFAGDAAICQS